MNLTNLTKQNPQILGRKNKIRNTRLMNPDKFFKMLASFS
jgi:hypothetical protein